MHYDSGRYEVVHHDLQTGSVTILSPGERTAMRGWSNGREFTYMSVRGNTDFLVFGELRGEGDIVTNEVLLPPGSRHLVLSLTSDGESTVYSAQSRVLVRNLRSGEERVVYEGPAVTTVRELSLSPDRRQLLIAREKAGEYFIEIWPLVPDTSVVVARESDILMRPRWLADGSGVSFIQRSSGSWRAMRWTFDAPSPVVVYQSPRFIESAELHPNGREMILTLGESAEFQGYFTGLHVWRLDLKTGAMSRVEG